MHFIVQTELQGNNRFVEYYRLSTIQPDFEIGKFGPSDQKIDIRFGALQLQFHSMIKVGMNLFDGRNIYDLPSIDLKKLFVVQLVTQALFSIIIQMSFPFKCM